MSLSELKSKIAEELHLINYPAASWVKPSPTLDFDVLIVGAGMAGLACAFELRRQGIEKMALIDRAPPGREGPWRTHARMQFLRSGKALAGPAIGFPLLTFQAWFHAQFGKAAWAGLYKIPTQQWQDYLDWFREILALPVVNHTNLEEIALEKDHIRLTIKQFEQYKSITTRKVVLATGREGFGGLQTIPCISELPHAYWNHTNEHIAFEKLRDKSIVILGVGAAGFDAAATALEFGAKEVSLWTRRPNIPNINKTASLSYPGSSEGYYSLSDAKRWKIREALVNFGGTPPFESLDRVMAFPNLKVVTDISIERASDNQRKVQLVTNRGLRECDFVVLATGYSMDGSQQKELSTIYGDILLWKNRPIAKQRAFHAEINNSPYLGPGFEFLPKPGGNRGVSNIYCFNYAATMSHGHLSGDIPEIGTGAQRLARGVIRDLFDEDWSYYYKNLLKFHKHEFLAKDYQKLFE